MGVQDPVNRDMHDEEVEQPDDSACFVNKNNPDSEQPDSTGLAGHEDLRTGEAEQPGESTCLVDKDNPGTKQPDGTGLSEHED